MKSKWAEDEEDAEVEAQRKREKEEKKRAKAEKLRKQEEQQEAARRRQAQTQQQEADHISSTRPAKRRRLPTDDDERNETRDTSEEQSRPLLRIDTPSWTAARTIDCFERLNHIEEGTYGYVSRAKKIATGEIVAIKKMKMDFAANAGFPVTALREIQTLNAAKHRHIVDLREVVVGEDGDTNQVFLVMDFLEHDLRTLMEDMEEPWLPSETKTLMLQLGSAVEFLHERWILHRDLKTSNILMNNRGQIKLADFGMARFSGRPPPDNLTQLVVTLWYRSPELLLGTPTYDTSVDMWSVGCIFGELLTKEPLLQGKNEVDQLARTFDLCGIPNEKSWPGFRQLPNARTLKLPPNVSSISSTTGQTNAKIRSKFPFLSSAGCALLSSLLSLNPASRPSASGLLAHDYFKEDPRPKSTAMFPTFPSKAGQERRRKRATPDAPGRLDGKREGAADVDFSGMFAGRADEEHGGGFQLKML